MFNLNNISEIVVGYSLKKNIIESLNWDNKRRKQYLINENLTKIISIDDTVLDSINLLKKKIIIEMYYFGQSIFEEFVLYANELSLMVTMPNDLYDLLHEFCKDNNIYLPLYLIPPLNYKMIECEFLGYDIADFGMTSALCNCGFSSSEKRDMILKYKPRLNKYGLFKDIQIANSFRKDSNARVKEHSPFYIFGLYKLKRKKIDRECG